MESRGCVNDAQDEAPWRLQTAVLRARRGRAQVLQDLGGGSHPHAVCQTVLARAVAVAHTGCMQRKDAPKGVIPLNTVLDVKPSEREGAPPFAFDLVSAGRWPLSRCRFGQLTVLYGHTDHRCSLVHLGRGDRGIVRSLDQPAAATDAQRWSTHEDKRALLNC